MGICCVLIVDSVTSELEEVIMATMDNQLEKKQSSQMQEQHSRQERVKWYQQARFGMFIHWGLYAIPAQGEWLRSVAEMPADDYDPLINEFAVERFRPAEWAKLAKRAGMKYAVLTAKHHDGFCLFDSKLTDFTSVKAPCKRDLVREFLEAFRAEGIKVGLYFSLIDWRHPDYPHYGDQHHPMRRQEAYKGQEHDFDNYLAYMHGQVEELVTGYGKLDIMWFDFSYDKMNGEKWQAEKLMAMVRSHQPDILCDNRLEGSSEKAGSIKTLTPSPYAGDFASPEQMIPPKGLVNQAGQPIPWEACLTLNDHWGYHATDTHYKTAKLIVRTLVECVSKGGNLILNVGPDAYGQIPAPSVAILEEVGDWLSRNGDSIYGCRESELPKPEWGRWTQNDKYMYAHILEEQVGAICLEGLKDKIRTIRRLADGSEIKETFYWNLTEYLENAFCFLYPETASSYPLPDERDTVLKIECRP